MATPHEFEQHAGSDPHLDAWAQGLNLPAQIAILMGSMSPEHFDEAAGASPESATIATLVELTRDQAKNPERTGPSGDVIRAVKRAYLGHAAAQFGLGLHPLEQTPEASEG